MLVRELIEKLQEFNPDERVLVSGYEGGFDDPGEVYAMSVTSRGYDSYSGAYDEWADWMGAWLTERSEEHFPAAVIPR